MWSKLSIIGYLASLTSLLMMLFRFNPFHWEIQYVLFFGVFMMGLLGFVFSILSNFFDSNKKNKTNKIQTLIFYIGMIIVFGGLFTLMLNYPSLITFTLFGVGLVVMGLSFLFKNKKNEPDEELLDS